MNIFKIFQKNKKEYIESLQFFYFLTDARKYLFPRYSWSTNWLILTFFRILDWCCSWNLNQIADYLQFLKDSVFCESRDYYHENLQRFIARELKPSEFINHVLYPIQSDKRKARDLEIDFSQQAQIEFDPKSFQFSKIILDLQFILEGFDEEEEAIITEEELREAVKLALKDMDKYFTN